MKVANSLHISLLAHKRGEEARSINYGGEAGLVYVCLWLINSSTCHFSAVNKQGSWLIIRLHSSATTRNHTERRGGGSEVSLLSSDFTQSNVVAGMENGKKKKKKRRQRRHYHRMQIPILFLNLQKHNKERNLIGCYEKQPNFSFSTVFRDNQRVFCF